MSESQIAFAALSVCDRIAFAWQSRRNRTATMPCREKTRKLGGEIQRDTFSGPA